MNLQLPFVPVIALMSACMGSSSSGAEPAPAVQLRQRIIRAPEEEVLKALEKKPDDDALAKQLLQWLESGKAKVMSDLTAPANPKVRFEAKDGKVYKWVTENDQEFDAPVLTPTSWQDVFLGTTLEGENQTEPWPDDAGGNGAADPFSGDRRKPEEIPGGMHALSITWKTEVRAQMASKVLWPLVWPENKKPVVGTYLQDDFLTQSVISSVLLQPGRENVVAFLRPATDLETEPATRELDVVLLHASTGKTPAPSPAATNFPAAARVHLFGFGVSDQEALQLLTTRHAGSDAALLKKLQGMAQEGNAARRLVCGSQTNSFRTTLSSVREHSYPTEMQTIPSAWSMRPVGTYVEMELLGRYLQVRLEHHPARFRWAEWACALDAPELIMRQPQFFVQRLETEAEFPADNVVLLGAMRTPECLKGSDKGPVMGETMMVFAELNQPSGTPPIKPYDYGSPAVHMDLEAMIFELPATEAAEWNGTETNEPVDDEQRFQKALAKVKEGTASVVCHLTMSARAGNRSKVESVEEVVYVTEYNPVDHNPTGRYRPTALEMRPVGSIWEVDPAMLEPQALAVDTPIIPLNYALQHDALPAVQPTLKEAMKYTQDHPYDLPAPVFTTDEWRGSVQLHSGKARCLGSVQPKGARFQNRIHVAFLRGTAIK